MSSFFDRNNIKNILLNFLGIGLKVLRPLYLIVFARVLGIELYGIYVLIYVIFEIFSKLTTLGMGGGLMHLLEDLQVEYQQYKPMLIYFIACFSFCWSVLLCVLVYFCLNQFGDVLGINADLQKYIIYYLPVTPFFSVDILFLNSLRNTMKIKYEVFNSSLVIPGIVFTLGYILSKYFGLIGIIYAHLVSYIVSCLLYMYFIHISYGPLKVQISILQEIDWKKFRSNSLYFMGIRSLNLLKHHLDTLVIGYYLSFREIALYSVVIEISTVIRKVRMGLEPMLMPYIKKVGYHTKRYGDEVRSLLYFMSMCSLILVLGLCFYADFWFQLFGSSFKADSWVLIFLALSQYMFAVFGVLEIALYMYGESRAAFEQNVLMLVLNLVFTLLLIHPYGIYGAAFSTLLATIITSMVTLKRHHTVTQIHVFDLTFFGHVLLAIGAIGFYKTMHISSNKGIISHTYAIFFIGLFVYGFYKRVMLQRKA